MCTLIVASRLSDELPLVIAANRDERLDRPSEPPHFWADRPIVAPRDLRSGGTWLGLNKRGLFVGVTNRFGSQPPDPGRRSRGQLVLDALEEQDASRARDRMAVLPPAQHNRNHLVLADARSAFLLVNDGRSIEVRELGPGVHVITERSFGASNAKREAMLRERLAREPEALGSLSALAALLRIHADDPFDGTCVHAPNYAYGTRSSTLIRLTEAGPALWLHAEGFPCQAEYKDLSGELAALGEGV